jgi:hypothetical protein
MKKLLLSALTLAFTGSVVAQSNNNINPVPASPLQVYKGHRGCGTPVPPKEWDEAFNKEVEKFKEKLASGKVAVTGYTIPVIVHVIHGGQPVGQFPNITKYQVNSQIQVLNDDYAGVGLNVGNLAVTAFSAVGAANVGIHFCPATQDTDGVALAEPGIQRINFSTKGWADPTTFSSTSAFQNYINTVVKPGCIWDPGQFLNIWVTDENVNSVGLLGFATFPSGAVLSGLPGNSLGTATTDGVWCWSACYGTKTGKTNQDTVTLSAPYDLGRTASHEIGHYFGLRHIGGDGNNNVAGDCTATDYCADTPPQTGGFSGGQYGQNFGGPSYPLHANVCSPNDPHGDMFMNFMDYVDDAFCYMFTPNQATRMQTALNTGTYRSGLTASSATQCAMSPVASISMTNSACPTVAQTVTNTSTGNPTPTYSWSANPSAGVGFNPSSTDPNPTITFPSAGSYVITTALTNGSGSTTVTNTVVVNACVGIKENAMLSTFISLQPNPSSGRVNLVTSLPSAQSIDVTVHNSLGQIIYSTSQKSVAASVIGIDLSAQPAGIYFVTVSNGTEKAVKRLILTK